MPSTRTGTIMLTCSKWGTITQLRGLKIRLWIKILSSSIDLRNPQKTEIRRRSNSSCWKTLNQSKDQSQCMLRLRILLGPNRQHLEISKRRKHSFYKGRTFSYNSGKIYLEKRSKLNQEALSVMLFGDSGPQMRKGTSIQKWKSNLSYSKTKLKVAMKKEMCQRVLHSPGSVPVSISN